MTKKSELRTATEVALTHNIVRMFNSQERHTSRREWVSSCHELSVDNLGEEWMVHLSVPLTAAALVTKYTLDTAYDKEQVIRNVYEGLLSKLERFVLPTGMENEIRELIYIIKSLRVQAGEYNKLISVSERLSNMIPHVVPRSTDTY